MLTRICLLFYLLFAQPDSLNIKVRQYVINSSTSQFPQNLKHEKRTLECQLLELQMNDGNFDLLLEQTNKQTQITFCVVRTVE